MFDDLKNFIQKTNPTAEVDANNISSQLEIELSVDKKLKSVLESSLISLEKTYLYQKYRIIADSYLKKIKKILKKNFFELKFIGDGLKINISDDGILSSEEIEKIMQFMKTDSYSFKSEWGKVMFIFHYKEGSDLDSFVKSFKSISPSYFY